MQLLFLYRRVLITLLAQPVSLPGKAAASKAGGFWASIMKNRQKASAHAAATENRDTAQIARLGRATITSRLSAQTRMGNDDGEHQPPMV